jgi:DNA-binding beta-propeller fold protein YncE
MRFLATLLAVVLGTVPVAAAPSGNRYEVVHGWPVLPDGEMLGQTSGVAVDSHGNVLVFHRADRRWREPLKLDAIKLPTLILLDGRTGETLKQWGSDLFALPHGLTIDDHDNVWVTDVALNQVFKFSPDGKLLMTLGERGVAGTDAGHFDKPTDVAVLADGSFYVSDGYGNSRVAKFTPEGKFLFQWGVPGKAAGEFQLPHAVVTDAAGNVYVADRENDRVQVFDAAGHPKTAWRDAAFGRPYGLAMLGRDRMVIVDGGEQPETGPDRSGAAIVDLGGHVLGRFGHFGVYDGQFVGAHDVATSTDGAIFVVEAGGYRVQKFVPQR